MSHVDQPLISDIRVASRDLVRQFGLMNQGVAGTDLSLSSVHAIIEIGRARELSATGLCEKLLLEKSTVSRLVKSLIGRGEVREQRSPNDRRIKHLQLTARGKKTLRAIDAFAEAQVSGALDRLDRHSRLCVLKGLRDYSAALKGGSFGRGSAGLEQRIKIETGYVPALIGRLVVMLHTYMNEHLGFGRDFESRIARDIAEFMTRIESPRNRIWRAELDGEFVGSISIDGEDLEDGVAHLRWFIVGDSLRGCGVGNELLSRAINFCDARDFDEIHLWTVKGLDAAAKLYRRHDFDLVEEYSGDQWGTETVEHKYVRRRARSPLESGCL